MSSETKIQWCAATINFWWGCTKVSPGCAKCYADTLSHRWGKDIWGKGKPREDHRKGAIALARKLNREAERTGIRLKVFCQSMSDWLDDEVPIEWLADLLATIHATPNLDWLLLTKRPENWLERICSVFEFTGQSYAAFEERKGAHLLTESWLGEGESCHPPKNVWIGTSVEDQQRADERIPKLLEVPARIRFLSVEPMLGPVDLIEWMGHPLYSGVAHHQRTNHNGCGYGRVYECEECDFSINLKGSKPEPMIIWVIFGGESGPGARQCNIDWIRDGLRQCKAAGVAAFVKQLGSKPCQDLLDVIPEATPEQIQEDPMAAAQWDIHREMNPIHLRDRKGGDMEEWPEDLRVREFPA